MQDAGLGKTFSQFVWPKCLLGSNGHLNKNINIIKTGSVYNQVDVVKYIHAKCRHVIHGLDPSIFTVSPLKVMFVQMVFSLISLCRESQAAIGMINDKVMKRKTRGRGAA